MDMLEVAGLTRTVVVALQALVHAIVFSSFSMIDKEIFDMWHFQTVAIVALFLFVAGVACANIIPISLFPVSVYPGFGVRQVNAQVFHEYMTTATKVFFVADLTFI